MRAAPDVILIGEIRDRESMESAITLAGTGHLVLATLHANNCAETLDRIINMFPHDQHPQMFLDLSQYLRAIMSQRLVPGKDGKRVRGGRGACSTRRTSQELIKKGDVIGVKEADPHSAEKGMQSFDIALYELYKQGKITLEEALATPTRAPTSRRRSTSAEAGGSRGWRALRVPLGSLERQTRAPEGNPERTPDVTRLSARIDV